MLQPKAPHLCWSWSNEYNSLIRAGFCKFGVLAQSHNQDELLQPLFALPLPESVESANNSLPQQQIRSGQTHLPSRHAGHRHRLRVDSNRSNSQAIKGADDPAGNFTPIGNQNFSNMMHEIYGQFHHQILSASIAIANAPDKSAKQHPKQLVELGGIVTVTGVVYLRTIRNYNQGIHFCSKIDSATRIGNTIDNFKCALLTHRHIHKEVNVTDHIPLAQSVILEGIKEIFHTGMLPFLSSPNRTELLSPLQAPPDVSCLPCIVQHCH
jgi:hypothetical protein